MAETVTIVVNDREYRVPAGANLVDAARSIGDHIPVFCYHPKDGAGGHVPHVPGRNG